MYYKATRDGDFTFHEKTDKWEGYIILIKDTKNNIFGGYTSKNFRGNFIADFYYGSEKNDKTAFLFNLSHYFFSSFFTAGLAALGLGSVFTGATSTSFSTCA